MAEGQAVQRATRQCPGCGAAVRPGADWCTLCFADLRPVPPPRLPVPVSPVPPAAVGTATSPLAVPPGSRPARAALVPCTVCETPMPIAAMICTACGSGLLDGLRSTQVGSLRLPLVGDLMRFGRGARASLALGLALTAVLAVLLPFVVFS